MVTTVREELRGEFLSTLRKGQDIALDALKTLVETIEFITPAIKPHEVVAGANDFAEQLLANQRQFADEVITVMSPLLPGKAGKPVVTSSERKPAAAGKTSAAAA
jgi:hypothetical protein